MDTNENSRTPGEQNPKKTAPRMSASDVGGRPRRPVEARKEAAKKRPAEAASAPRKRPAQPSAERQERPAGTSRPAQPRKPSAEGTAQRREAASRPRTDGKSTRTEKPRQAQESQRRRQAPKAKTGDSGYQPYRKANQKRKAQRSTNFKTFFSSQNPILKWYEKVRYSKDSFAENSDLAKQRKERRAADAEKRRRKQNVFNTPAVIYTQPASFNRDRLIVQLITVLAVVAAFMIGLSVFFKVKVITVSGATVYSPYSIQEASGITEGDNLLTFSRARAASQIRAKLPYVKSVRIGIKLPDTVNIEIVEDDVVYAIQSDTGIWWLMNSQGKVTEMANNSVAKNYTQILGVTLTDPAVGAIGVPTELTADQTSDPTNATDVTDASAASDPTTLPTVTGTVVTGAQRMAAVLEILQALEENDIVGEVASVDVSQLNDVVLWYGTQYQVNLGDANDTVHSLKYKIACMYDAILQMTDYSNGILDVSFTTWENQVGLTPFS